MALIAKLGWQFISDENKLWVKVLKTKYLTSHSFWEWPCSRPASHTWRSIVASRNFIRKNIQWQVGNGCDISIWDDAWCGSIALRNSLQPASVYDNFKVKELIVEGCWNITKIENILGENMVSTVLRVPIKNSLEGKDIPRWADPTNGMFTTKSAYSLYSSTGLDMVNKGKLLTNSVRVRRGLSQDDVCPRCNSGIEDLNHLFRECPFSVQFWTGIKWRRWIDNCSHFSLTNWLQHNLRSKNTFNKMLWSFIFIAGLWNLWKFRCKKVFENTDFNAVSATHVTMDFANAIELAARKPQIYVDHDKCLKLITWVPPFAGRVKLNVDGSVQEGTRHIGGIGGLFRDENGAWMLGFIGKLDDRSPLETELWAIYRGLTIAIAKDFKNIDIESDAASAVKLITNDTPSNCLFYSLIVDIKFLLVKCNALITYAPREGNACADLLAKLGKDMTEEFRLLKDAPESLCNLLSKDREGIGNLRF